MTNTRQKASDDKDCHTSLLSQGGASDLRAHSTKIQQYFALSPLSY